MRPSAAEVQEFVTGYANDLKAAFDAEFSVRWNSRGDQVDDH
jgi:hypothetical protein